jgi:hypothetical protein
MSVAALSKESIVTVVEGSVVWVPSPDGSWERGTVTSFTTDRYGKAATVRLAVRHLNGHVCFSELHTSFFYFEIAAWSIFHFFVSKDASLSLTNPPSAHLLSICY